MCVCVCVCVCVCERERERVRESSLETCDTQLTANSLTLQNGCKTDENPTRANISSNTCNTQYSSSHVSFSYILVATHIYNSLFIECSSYQCPYFYIRRYNAGEEELK